MPGITDSLKIALSGLQLAQNSLATTSNNVANANTPGYSRKIVEQEARVLDGRGTGVREVKIARKMDEFLEVQIRQQQAALGKAETITAYADDVQGLIFGNPSDGATGLATYVDELGTALEGAATKPEDAAQRAAVTWAAEDLFGQLGGAAETVQVLRRDADRRIHGLVAEVNEALGSLHDLNLNLNRSGDNAELLDQRDRLVRDLSYKLDIKTYTHEDGTLAVFTPDGQPLLEYSPRTIVYTPPSVVERDAPFPAIEVYDHSEIDPATSRPLAGAPGRVLVGAGTRLELTPELKAAGGHAAISPTLTNGELGGLLQVRDRVLPQLDDQLQEAGALMAFALNAAHNDANPVGGHEGTVRGSRTLDALTTPPATFAGVAFIEVSDGTTSTTHRLDLAALGSPGAIAGAIDALPHLSATANAGEPLEITADAGWRFAVANATADDSQDASAITQAELPPPHTAEGHVWTYNFAQFFGLNDLVTRDANTGDLAVRADIAADPMRIASTKLAVTTPDPALPGTVESVLGGIGDTRGLNQLAAALDRQQTSVARGNLPPANVTAREYIGDIINIQAIHAQTAERAAKNDTILADELDFQRAGISGVNMDEEMAHLLQLQQSYATAARLMTAADEMLQELLNVKR